MLTFRSAAGRVTRLPDARRWGQDISPERLATLGPTQFPIQWVPGALPAGVNWRKSAANHQPPFKAGFKGDWSHIYIYIYIHIYIYTYTYISCPAIFHGVHINNFIPSTSRSPKRSVP